MRKLGNDELRDALDQLPRWSGTAYSIERRAELPHDKAVALTIHALDVSEDLGSELLFRRTNGAVAFWLRTPQAEGVTNLDIEVAKRIDALLLLAVDTAELPLVR